MVERKEEVEPEARANVTKLERFISAQWVLFGTICAAFYGYVALDYDADPDSCIATDEY